jgi:signal transduction histidine kinase
MQAEDLRVREELGASGSWAKATNSETSFEVQPDFPRLAPELETAIFRIVQEALTNVFKHSEARKVWINLSRRDSQMIVSVRDDGKGIKKRTADLQPDSIGIGLGGMRQRAKEFGESCGFRMLNRARWWSS